MEALQLLHLHLPFVFAARENPYRRDKDIRGIHTRACENPKVAAPLQLLHLHLHLPFLSAEGCRPFVTRSSKLCTTKQKSPDPRQKSPRLLCLKFRSWIVAANLFFFFSQQSSLSFLKKLRGSCKNELEETINQVPLNFDCNNLTETQLFFMIGNQSKKPYEISYHELCL
ncbi:hypothetical protein NE237_022567 [Protea cynaroides]|uniref:Uncharacterized protein n=1 Tax=Protea cynaroides TaxID=273540 RepID=A0A9Q0K5Y4_9MAGN|nr:hypothetical protein NE237_022567 [Protea cynaroides]